MGAELNGSYKERIDQLAEIYRIVPSYDDVRGRRQETGLESKISILNAMGVPTDNLDVLDEALKSHESELWSRLCDPVRVIRAEDKNGPLQFRLKLEDPKLRVPPQDLVLRVVITDESGDDIHQLSLDHTYLKLLEKKEVSKETFGLFSAALPVSLPLGYYTFQITALQGTKFKLAVVKVIVTPERAYLPPHLEGEKRLAGLWVSLYGLRSGQDWGIGDFGDLKRLAAWAGKELQVSFIGISPLHSLFNRGPNNVSPYSPISRLYRNFIYLDIPALEDFAVSDLALEIVSSPEVGALLEELRGLREVDYERVADLKWRVLLAVFFDFLHDHWDGERPATEKGAAFQSYMDQEGKLLDDYAVFTALHAHFNREPGMWTWAQWPQRYQNPHSQEVKRFAEEHRHEVLFQKYLQYQIHEQLKEVDRYIRDQGMPLGIYQDLAMSDDPYGSDRWANPELYIEKVQIGAPPDDFSPNGQNWGFPAPDLERMREKGYAYFIQEIKNNCRFSGCLRMDHVMRLFHYFWIMEGKEPSQGAYVAARHEELLGILALESVRNQVLMIGEDLGTVQPYVREALERYGVFSYRLLYFEKHEEGRFKSPSEYPPCSLATVTTHDLPTLCGFWQGMDLLERNILGLFPDEVSYSNALRTRQEDKQRLLDALFEEGLMPPYASRNAKDYLELSGELHNGAVGYLARSRAKLMQLNQEDLFKDLRQQNMPGNTRERKNWVARMLFRTDDLHHNTQVGRFAGMYRNWIIHSNRTPEK